MAKKNPLINESGKPSEIDGSTHYIDGAVVKNHSNIAGTYKYLDEAGLYKDVGVVPRLFRMNETNDYGVTGTTIYVDHTLGVDGLDPNLYYGATTTTGNRFLTLQAACHWVNRSNETYVVIQIINTSVGSRHTLTADAVIKGRTNVFIVGTSFASKAHLNLSTFRIIGANTRLSLGRLDIIFSSAEPIISIDGSIIEVNASEILFPAIVGAGLFWASNGIFHISDRVTITLGANGQSIFNPKSNYGGKCVFNTHALAAPTFNVGAFTGLLWCTGDRSWETYFSNAIALSIPSTISMVNSINYYNSRPAFAQSAYNTNAYNYALSLGTTSPLMFEDLDSTSSNLSYTTKKKLIVNENGVVGVLDDTGGGGITRSINNISGNTTAGAVTSTDYVYFCTATLTLTLPTAVGNTNRYTVKCIAGTLTIDGNGAETIDGTASIVVAVEDSVDLISNNTEWKIV